LGFLGLVGSILGVLFSWEYVWEDFDYEFWDFLGEGDVEFSFESVESFFEGEFVAFFDFVGGVGVFEQSPCIVFFGLFEVCEVGLDVSAFVLCFLLWCHVRIL